MIKKSLNLTQVVSLLFLSIFSTQALYSSDSFKDTRLRTFTQEKTGNIYTIEFNVNDLSTGKITRVSGDPKAEKKHKDKKVDLTCIKPGAMGMPNVSTDNYLGMFKFDKHKCYVFLHKEEKEEKE